MIRLTTVLQGVFSTMKRKKKNQDLLFLTFINNQRRQAIP